MRKMTCEVYLSTPRRLQWIAINVTERSLKKNYHELHQLLDVFHQESLEEECHLLYFAGDIGSAISSPDSRRTRFLMETAARKSGRSRTGAFLPDLLKVRYHCPWYLLNSSVDRWYV